MDKVWEIMKEETKVGILHGIVEMVVIAMFVPMTYNGLPAMTPVTSKICALDVLGLPALMMSNILKSLLKH